MFFIVNKTTHNITIGDLGLNLGPHQAIDLDKIMKRSKSEASKGLKTASRNGDIEIRRKDDPKPHKIMNTVSNKSSDLSKMKKEIIGEMKELLKGHGGVSKEDLQALISAMPKGGETVIIRQDGENIRQDEEVEMDEEVLGEMSKRAVNEMVKDVKSGEVKYKQEKQEDDLMNNISELEQLLG